MLTGPDGEIDPVESAVPEAVQAEFTGGGGGCGGGGVRSGGGGGGGVRSGGRPRSGAGNGVRFHRAARRLARRGQHVRDPGGGRAGLGEFGADPGQYGDRAGQEEGEADGGDEGPEADGAAEHQAAADEGDQRDEGPGEGEHQAGLEGGGAGGAHVGLPGRLAGGPVAGDGRALRLEPLEHPDPGDQVGGDPGGVGGPLLLGLAAVLQRAGEVVAQRHEDRGADQYEETERDGGPEQQDRARDDPDDGGDAEGEGHVEGPDPPGVLGGHVDQGPGRPPGLGAAVRGEDPAYDVETQPVRGLLGGTLPGPGAEAEAVREHRVDHGEDHQPQGQRSPSGRTTARSTMSPMSTGTSASPVWWAAPSSEPTTTSRRWPATARRMTPRPDVSAPTHLLLPACTGPCTGQRGGAIFSHPSPAKRKQG